MTVSLLTSQPLTCATHSDDRKSEWQLFLRRFNLGLLLDSTYADLLPMLPTSLHQFPGIPQSSTRSVNTARLECGLKHTPRLTASVAIDVILLCTVGACG